MCCFSGAHWSKAMLRGCCLQVGGLSICFVSIDCNEHLLGLVQSGIKMASTVLRRVGVAHAPRALDRAK